MSQDIKIRQDEQYIEIAWTDDELPLPDQTLDRLTLPKPMVGRLAEKLNDLIKGGK